MMLLVPAGYVGEAIQGRVISFSYNTIDANGEPTTDFRNAGDTGDPLFLCRRMADGAQSTAGLTHTLNQSAGRHVFDIDTSNTFYQQNSDYEIYISSGSVNDGTQRRDVSETVVGVFSVSHRPAGRLYEQVIKLDAGYVTAVGVDNRRDFTGYMTVGEADIADFYVGQTLTFQPTSSQAVPNSSTGRAILKSDPVQDGNQIVFQVQNPFATPITVGDTFAILPEERELDIVTANITVEFGVGQNVGDQYSVDVIVNGEPLGVNASSVLDGAVQLKVWLFSTDVEIIDQAMIIGLNSGLYKFTGGPGIAVQPNDGAVMQATMSIDSINYTFRRTIFNYV